ncbi:MAG: hypothetical protein ACTSVY_00780 [Candidatus Helarchaeota archaeon]
MSNVEDALQKIEKFKNSFKKNLEKSLTELKKNLTNIVASVESSKTNFKKSFQKSIETLKSSNINLQNRELTNLQAFQDSLNENLDAFISSRINDLNTLRQSFILNLNNLNSKLKEIAQNKVDIVQQTYQDIIESVEKTFKQYLNDFLTNIESSRVNLIENLNKLEEETFETVSKHYQDINEIYSENKDSLNNLILMVFNEIKTTSEANFRVVKEQVKFLHKSTEDQLVQNNNVFIEYFKKLRDKYNDDLKKFSTNMNEFFNQYKKSKISNSNLLLNKIKTNIEIGEMQAFSKIVDAMKIYSEESNKRFSTYNQMIHKNLEESINKFVEELTTFNQESQTYFSTFLSAQAENIQELKSTVEARLNNMIKDQNELGEQFKVDYLKILMSQIKEYSQQTELFLKQASDAHETMKKELNVIEQVNEQTLISFEQRILSAENHLNDLFKGTYSITNDEAFKKEIRNVLEVIKDIRDYNESFKEHLKKNHEKNIKESQKSKNSINKILIKNHKILETGMMDIQKTLDKKIETFLKKFNSNVEDLKSKGDLFGNLDLQIETFNSSIEGIAEEILKIKNSANNNLISILNDLNNRNNEIITNYDKLLKNQIVDFYNKYENYMVSNIKHLHTIASEIISENEEISPLKLPEVDKIFNNVIKIFKEYLVESEEINKKIMDENQNEFFDSCDDLEEKINNNIEQFGIEINTLFEINQTEHQNLLTFFKESYESQFTEFEDRLNQDLISLKNANQDNISKIMIKTAETGNKFFEKVKETSKQSKLLINTFLKTFNSKISEFNLNFSQTMDEVKDIILSKITENNDLLFREQYDLPQTIQNEYELGFRNYQQFIDEFMEEHKNQLDDFKNKSIEILKERLSKQLTMIIQNINESEEIQQFLTDILLELDENVKKYSKIIEESISDLKKIFKKLSEKDNKLDDLINSL